MRCPRCASGWVRPGYRRGAFDRLMSVARLHPYRCQACAHRFRCFSRGWPTPALARDRREFERIPAKLSVFFWNADCHGEGKLANLSAGGCWVEGVTPVQEGAPVELLIHTTTGESVDTAGVVARLTPGKGFALQFLATPPDQRLHSLLEHCYDSVPA